MAFTPSYWQPKQDLNAGSFSRLPSQVTHVAICSEEHPEKYMADPAFLEALITNSINRQIRLLPARERPEQTGTESGDTLIFWVFCTSLKGEFEQRFLVCS